MLIHLGYSIIIFNDVVFYMLVIEWVVKIIELLSEL